MTTLHILCPVYFDVESYILLQKNINTSIEKSPYSQLEIKFWIVDDSAGQDLAIKQISTNTSVITPPFNLGHQRAIVFGMRQIVTEALDTDIICTMDSDGEDRPEDLPQLLSKLLEGHRIVMAQRTKRRETFVFKTLYKLYKLFFILLTGKVISTGNYLVTHAKVIASIIYHPHFDLCYSSAFLALKIPYSTVGCERGSRYSGQSKMNFSSLIMHGIRMLMPFMDQISIRSLMAFGILFFLGIIASLTVLSIKFFTSLSIPGWASTIITMTIIFSTIALGNFLVLFATFSQSQSTAFKFLDKLQEKHEGRQ